MRIKNHEYYAEMVQRAVDKGQAIRKWMDEYSQLHEGQIAMMVISEQTELAVKEVKETRRKLRRRLKALNRIVRIQAQAYKIAYGVDAPTIPELR